MKKKIATTLTAAVILGSLSTTAFAANQNFKDINGSYAKDAIIELQAMGILTGIDDTHFAPKSTLTRAQFVTIIVRELGLPATATTSTFSDVKGWAVPYVEAAVAAKIVEGVGNGTFAPNAKLTREEAATILVRALQLKGQTVDATAIDFKDSASIAEWAKNYIAIAQHYGLIKGNPDGTFNPKGTATREMAATMGMNLLGALEMVAPPVVTPPDKPPVDDPDDTSTTPPVVTPPAGGGGGGYYPPPVQADADLTAYNAALASVKEADYTAESWATYKTVVDANVVTKSDTQAKVDAATAAIKAAQSALVKKPVVVIDVTAPEITLKGQSVVDVVYGTTYTDEGATATDNKDGDLAVVVTITNEASEPVQAIDTTVPGTYTVHYNVSDAAGNAATEVTRSVKVAAEVVEPPVVADLTAYNTALGAVNEEDYTPESWSVYLDIVAANMVTKDNTQATVDAATAAITAAQANLVAKPPVVVEADLTAYNAALAAVSEETYTADSWAAYQEVVAAHVVTKDNTQLEVDAATTAIIAAQADLVEKPPVVNPVAINDVSIVSNNVDPTKANVGDTVTLTFTTSEKVDKLSNFKIGGNNPDSFASEQNGDVWTNTATYTIQESDAVGALSFQINVKNGAGIYSVTTEATTDGSSVTVIEQPVIVSPVAVTNVHIASNNVDPTKATVGDTVTLSFVTQEEVSKLGNFKINGGNPTAFASVEDNGVWTNTATYTIDASDPLAAMTFQINVKNAAGTYSQTIEATSDGSAVIVQEAAVAPVAINEVSIVSNNVDPTIANVGDKVTLTFTTNEEVFKLSNFKINGNNPDSFDSVQTGDVWTTTATYTIQDTDNDGPLSFQINVKNGTGVYSITTESTTDGSAVTINKLPVIPAPTVVSNETISPDGAGRVVLKFQLDKELDLASGNVSLHFLDVNGNEVNGASGTPIVKDNTWSGYLNSEDGLIKYGQGAEGNTEYINVLPANEVITATVTTAGYTGPDWFNAIASIRVDATDAAGQITSVSANMPTVEAAAYLTAQDFGPLTDGGYNLGFKINLANLHYDSIASMTGTLYDGDTAVAVVSANTPERIAKYQWADEQYGGIDGQFSLEVVDAETLADAGIPMVDGVYGSSYLEYTMPLDGTPTRAELTITTKTGITITVNYTM